MKKRTAALFAFLMASTSLLAQNALTLQDAVLRAWTTYNPSDLTMATWVPGSSYYAYLSSDYQNLVVQGADEEQEGWTVSALEVNEALKEFNVQIPGAWVLQWQDANTLYFDIDGQVFTYSIAEHTAERLYKMQGEAANVHIHSSTLHAAYTEGNGVSVSWNSDGHTYTNLSSARPDVVMGQAIARSEFGITEGLFWNEEGTAVAFYEKDESEVSSYPLLNINTTPGSLEEIKYPMAGQGSEYARVGVLHRDEPLEIYLDTDSEEHDAYLTNLSWSPDGNYIVLAQINRAQNHFDVVLYDAKTGKRLRTLFSESDEQWAEPEHPAFWVSNTEFVWMSERDDYMNLYLYNTSGNLVRQLTKNDFVASEILGRDASGNVLFHATGPDPREQHLYSVSLRGKQKQLTKEAGYHTATLQAGGRWFIDNFQSVEVPRKVSLVNTNGKLERVLLEAADPLANLEVSRPELGSIVGPDGSTLYTRLYKPANFDPSKKYPVLVYVYGGPHAQMVTNTWNAGGSLWMNYFADQGYLVFTLDNRGSANRGTNFEQQIHRQLGTVEMEDQLAGVAYLKSLPYVDGDRMAVHGWSYGGFMTTSLMLRQPGTFKVGVAGGPVTDWKYYEVMYGERYMDRPEENPDGYANNRLHNYVDQLEGELLLIHGTADDVVVMQHNLTLVKSFIEAGVQVDFFPYPMHPHNVRGKDRLHLMTKVLKYVEDGLQE